jgi:hypothetical protein
MLYLVPKRIYFSTTSRLIYENKSTAIQNIQPHNLLRVFKTQNQIMSRQQNQLIIAQRTKVGRQILRGMGGMVFLSMLIFGALSVQEEETAQPATSSQATTVLAESATLVQQSQAESSEFLAVETTANTTIMETEAETSKQAISESKSKKSTNSMAAVARKASVQKQANTQSAVEYAEVQTSLNATGISGLVQWSTLMEQNSKEFVIERSLDGESFAVLGTISAAGGKGIHQEKNSYSFEDHTLAEAQMPRAYYRVGQIGWDGKKHYTEVVEHDLQLGLGLYSAIIPVENDGHQYQIRYAGDQEGEMTLRVFMASGQVMVEQQLAVDFIPQSIALETLGWDKGTYFLQLINDHTSIMEQFTLR